MLEGDGPSAQELTQLLLQQQLDDLIGVGEDEDPIRVVGFEGIILVRSHSESLEEQDCYEYVFGREDRDDAIERLVATGIRTGHERGSIAFYFKENLLRHVGIVAADGNVVSKWGHQGPVLKHKPNLVPTSYGTIGGYYRDPLQWTPEQ